MSRALRVFAAGAALTLLAAAAPAAAAPDSDRLRSGNPVTIQHNVTCALDPQTPGRQTGSSVVAAWGYVRCDGAVEVASTAAQIQILENGTWRYYGNSTQSPSTSSFVSIWETGTLKPGCFSYRLRMTRSAFHENWDDSSANSGASWICY